MTVASASLELMLDCLSPTRLERSCQAFVDEGSPVPSVIWSPNRRQLLHPLIERFADKCTEMSRDDGHFHSADFNLAVFESLADWMMVLRIDPETDAFIYAHYGSGIADHFGKDMTGKTTVDFGGHISEFFSAVYQQVKHRREWVLTEHEPPKQIFVCSWRRLLLPLVNEDDQVTGFVAINVPESPLRAGLDLVPEPLFVLDTTQTVRFANTFAKSLFGLRATGAQKPSFTEITGIPLAPSDKPEDMFARSSVDNRIERLRIADRLEDDFLVTTSGAIHSGIAYYIVMLRMLMTPRSSTVPGQTAGVVGSD